MAEPLTPKQLDFIDRIAAERRRFDAQLKDMELRQQVERFTLKQKLIKMLDEGVRLGISPNRLATKAMGYKSMTPYLQFRARYTEMAQKLGVLQSSNPTIFTPTQPSTSSAVYVPNLTIESVADTYEEVYEPIELIPDAHKEPSVGNETFWIQFPEGKQRITVYKTANPTVVGVLQPFTPQAHLEKFLREKYGENLTFAWSRQSTPEEQEAARLKQIEVARENANRPVVTRVNENLKVGGANIDFANAQREQGLIVAASVGNMRWDNDEETVNIDDDDYSMPED